MTESLNQERFSKATVLLLVVAITWLFFLMIRGFISALLLAAVFSGMTYGLYQRLLNRTKSQALAAIVTILLVLLVIVLPLSMFAGIVAAEAVQVTQSVGPWVQRQLASPDQIERWLETLPFAEMVTPYKNDVTAKIGEIAQSVGAFLVVSVANLTRGTVVFFLQLFVMLYAMFFFLVGGPRILRLILYYLPLEPEQENRMVERFVSVARATLKGSLVIGVIQGALAGVAFAVVGVPSPAFWGTVMAVLSIIPGVGTALVWIPACIWLIAIGRLGAAIGLATWCVIVVGTVDNFLRPLLIGRDTKMSDLLVLLGTLGGLIVFGAIGFIIGPIIAALFVTVWDIYGEAFSEYLPEPMLPDGAPAHVHVAAAAEIDDGPSP
jgi:predicted PurR-regulated permease PerM